MKYYARRFFHEFVKLDPVNKTITLPGLMRVYWADFGGGRAKVRGCLNVVCSFVVFDEFYCYSCVVLSTYLLQEA